MEAVSASAAAEFIETCARPEVRPVSNLFWANSVGSDDRQWAANLNAYLSQFGLAPLTIEPGPVERFFRLSCPAPDRVVDGPKVSVIMPAFNASATLAFAARSILNQTWQNLELIIVDDASTDDTRAIMKDLADADGRVVLLGNSINVGPYVSKNRALGVATGTYLTGHDADDWAHPQRLQRQIEAMTAAGIGAGLASMLRINAHGEFCEFKAIGKSSFDGAARLASISCMFDVSAFRQRLGHWDSVRFGADSELIERARLVFGQSFQTVRQIAMLCLDCADSLTNHPVHGVPAHGGLSPVRADYRAGWIDWHSTLETGQAHMEFPQRPRRFAAPEVMIVSQRSIAQALS
jgi:Glycosyl transferase family 2